MLCTVQLFIVQLCIVHSVPLDGLLDPVSTLAVSSSWAAAVEAEATALQLALACLQVRSHVSAGFLMASMDLTAVLAVEGLNWFADQALRNALAAPTLLAPVTFAALVDLKPLPSLGSFVPT